MQDDEKNTPSTSGNALTPGISEADRIKELRERLYSRGTIPKKTERHAIPPRSVSPPLTPRGESGVQSSPPVRQPHVTPPEKIAPPLIQKEDSGPESKMSYTGVMASRKRKSIRKIIAIGSVAFFVVAVGIASVVMLSGNNVVSGSNITLTTSGPIAVGGGEEFPFQVSIANQNTVPIQSATLIIEYPRGTQSVTEANREILIERRPLNTVNAGELVNIELKARIFGEENDEKEIKVSIDYRVAGSNATFQKIAEPLKFKVSTSPVVVSIDSLKSISSGQEIELTFVVQSNSPSALSDILLKATYPSGFDFRDSDPDTVAGEDTWKIATLNPAEKKLITVKGVVSGSESDVLTFSAVVGVAGANDRNALASIFTNARSEVVIEQPFLNVGVNINGNTNETVVVNTNDSSTVEVSYRNELDTTIYDGKVLVELDGNALDEFEVRTSSGFYDSNNNTISWDGVDVGSLREIKPGGSSAVSFTLTPKATVGASPEIKLKVTVKGQRRFENRVSGELIGTAQRTIKVESIPTLEASVIYGSGPFTNTGPVPPIAEMMTQYTYALSVQTGTNAVTGAEVVAVMPQYVRWLDLVSDGDTVTYNATSRTLRWVIGDINANSEVYVAIQISFLPSISQIGTAPVLLETQRFRATDRFTGTVVETQHPAITTSLLYEGDASLEDGRVLRDD